MKRLVFGLALAALATAKPELYKEKEDFQYSRSSSDEGTKSGFYDAQRGNMGGNFERAHNMDTLAQHQMGGLVRQVEGELGDGTKTRTGSVFSSANTRGVYGSGHYDLSNLQGRNFQEGVSYDNSHLQSSTKNAYDAHSISNARSGSRALYDTADYRGYHNSNLQDAKSVYGENQFEQGAHFGSTSRHSSQSRYQDRNVYSQSNVNTGEAAENVESNVQHRLITTLPVKIVVRHGQRIAIPIATQTYRDAHITAYEDHNVAKSDAEILNSDNVQESTKPTSAGKHYESSFSYHKEWEKHDNTPGVVLSTNPVVKSGAYENIGSNYGSQYIDNGYEHSRDQNTAFSHSRYESDFDARHHSSASTNSNLNSFSQVGSNSDINSHSGNLMGVVSSRPKSYQSSFSYHKSWERQGDPYIINPATNGVYEGQSSGKLTDVSSTQFNCRYECKPGHIRLSRSTNTDNTEMEQQNQNLENFNQQTQWNNLEDLGQQIQGTWDQNLNTEQESRVDHGQQAQNVEDFSPQSQHKWGQIEYSGQQTQNNFDNLEDLGQQTQTVWDKIVDGGQQTKDLNEFSQQSQSKSDNLENFNQQTQNTFNDIESISKAALNKWDLQNTGYQSESHLHAHEQQSETRDKWRPNEYSGQQTQNKWDNFENFNQQTHGMWSNFENHGQQTQSMWHKVEGGQQTQDLNDFGQQSQSKLDNLENLDQQTQNTFNNIESISKETQSKWDLQNTDHRSESRLHADEQQSETQDKWGQKELSGQESQNNWSNLENLSQQANGMWSNFENHGQQTQSMWDKFVGGQQTQDLNDFGQQSQSKFDNLENLDQQAQNTFNNIESIGKETHSKWDVENTDQRSESRLHADEQQSETQDKWGQKELSGQESQNNWSNLENLSQQTNGMWSNFENHGQETQSSWDKFVGGQQTQDINDFGQQSQSKFDNLENLDQQTQNTLSNIESIGKETHSKWDLQNSGHHSESQLHADEQQSETQDNWGQNKYSGQQTNDMWSNFKNHDQQTQSMWDKVEGGQQTQNQWNLDSTSNQTAVNFNQKYHRQQIQDSWEKLDQTPIVESIENENTKQKSNPYENQNREKIETFGNNYNKLKKNDIHNTVVTESTSSVWNKINNLDINNQTFQRHEIEDKTNVSTQQQTVGIWDVITKKDERQQKNISDANSKQNLDSNMLKVHRSNTIQSNVTTEDQHKPKLRPVDIGRGDIDPEDLTIETIEISENTNNYDDAIKKNKAVGNMNKEIMNVQKHGLNNVVTENELQTSNVIVDKQFSQATNHGAFNNPSNKAIQEQQSEKQKNIEILSSFEQQNTAEQINKWDLNEKENYNEPNTKLLNNFDQQGPVESTKVQNQEFNQQNIDVNNFDNLGNVEKENMWNIPQQESSDFNQRNLGQFTDFEQKNNWDMAQQEPHFDEFEQRLLSGRHQTQQTNTKSDFSDYIPEPNVKDNTKNLDNIDIIEKKVYHPTYTGLEIHEISSTLEPTTAKPGFWKSVGNKLKNAKNKVSSWFGR